MEVIWCCEKLERYDAKLILKRVVCMLIHAVVLYIMDFRVMERKRYRGRVYGGGDGRWENREVRFSWREDVRLHRLELPAYKNEK